MEGTYWDIEIVDEASNPSKRPCVSLPAPVDMYVRTRKCGRDGLSDRNSVSLPGFEDCELSPRASAVSLVLPEDAVAGGDGGPDTRTSANAAQDAAPGRPAFGAAAANRNRAFKTGTIE